MVDNPSLWDEVNPVDNFPTYRLSETANKTRCRRCQSVVWHLLSRAGFEVRLDPERISLADAIEIAKAGKTYLFPTMRVGNSFVTGFLKSTANAYDMADADFDKDVYLAWHRCNPDNIRNEFIDHWSAKR